MVLNGMVADIIADLVFRNMFLFGMVLMLFSVVLNGTPLNVWC